MNRNFGGQTFDTPTLKLQWESSVIKNGRIAIATHVHHQFNRWCICYNFRTPIIEHHPFAMETVAILVHSLNRFSLCTKMAAVAVVQLCN